MNSATEREHESGDGRIRLEEDVSDVRLMVSLIALVLTVAIWLSPWRELPVLPHVFLPIGVLAFWSITFEFLEARKRASDPDRCSAAPADTEFGDNPPPEEHCG